MVRSNLLKMQDFKPWYLALGEPAPTLVPGELTRYRMGKAQV
jgi:hypothetical protein